MKGGLLDGKVDRRRAGEAARVAPSREQMLAELGAGLQSPMAAFVGALNGAALHVCGRARRAARRSAKAPNVPRWFADQHAPGHRTLGSTRRDNNG